MGVSWFLSTRLIETQNPKIYVVCFVGRLVAFIIKPTCHHSLKILVGKANTTHKKVIFWNVIW